MKGPKPKPLLERLMSRVNKTDTCWLWTGCVNIHGYGKIGIPGLGQGVTTATHRLAWKLLRGPIPEGINVCHHCDNPPCCNPDHLFLGTQKDNLQDMGKKGRHPGPGFFGETHNKAKLTEAKVIEIRRLHKEKKLLHSELAKLFNISKPNVSHILSRRTWKHV